MTILSEYYFHNNIFICLNPIRIYSLYKTSFQLWSCSPILWLKSDGWKRCAWTLGITRKHSQNWLKTLARNGLVPCLVSGSQQSFQANNKGCFPESWQGKNLETFLGLQELEASTQPLAGKVRWQLCGSASLHWGSN